MIGKTLGHYRVGEQLGRGGMGEVYVADDLNLNRKVALKFLPDAFAGDPERMARFEREAKLLASLNHPNIAAIYGLEQAEGKRFIVMELVEGETLQQRLSKGPLPMDEALGICTQIAEGLGAAHEKGVIHRDLKPANVMLTEGDRVKILDFGLAKALSDETQSVDSSQSPTLTEAMTRPGVILGTAAYMSPEQAKGKAVDKRADIWALGCILYECLTGKRAFDGETVTEILAAVLKGEPDWQALPAAMPLGMGVLLRRCLQRDLTRRLHDAADARIEMEEAITAPSSQLSPEPRNPARLAWIAAAIFLIAALALAIVHFSEVKSPSPVVSFTISPPNDAVFIGSNGAPRMALSPDGRFLAFTAALGGQTDLMWIRRLDSLEAKPVSGTEKAESPFWSPDSRFIAFFADGKLKRTEASGGPVKTLCDAPEFDVGGTWNRDGVIVFGGRDVPLRRVSSEGGSATELTVLDKSRSESSHRWPQFLPDGRHFLFLSFTERVEDCAVHIGSLDSKETTRLIKSESMASYGAPGQLLYVREGRLMAQSFDVAKLHLNGDARPLAESVIVAPNGRAAFSISEAGILAYRPGSSAARSPLMWVDRNGKPISLFRDQDAYSNIELSPNGKQASVCVSNKTASDIWIYDFGRDLKTRFTFGSMAFKSIWSPDAGRIVFNSGIKGALNLYQKASNGASTEGILFEDEYNKSPISWSPDGKFILYWTRNPKSGGDLFVLPVSGDRKPFPFRPTPFDEGYGQFSPDGRWIAYVSNESRTNEVYVAPFPGPGGKWQISRGSAIAPRWSRNGTEIFYITLREFKLMAASVNGKGSGFEVGAIKPLFNIVPSPSVIPAENRGYWYDVSGDGQSFLVNTGFAGEASTPVTVILNWTELLKN